MQIANKFPYPPKDGGSIATLSLSRSLAKLGHEVTVLAMNTSKHYIDIRTVPEDLSSKIRFVGVPVNTNIKVHRLFRNFFFSRWPYNAERFIDKGFDQVLQETLKEWQFDIIQLEGLYLAPYLDTIRAYSKAKVAMRAHNIEHEIWARTVAQQKGPRKVYLRHLAARIRKMEFRFLNRYDAVLPITARDGEMMKQMGCRLPMHVVPTGIEANELIPGHSAMEFPSVFHIGALDWMPNQEGLLWFMDNVWPAVLERNPGLMFYLAGRNAPPYFHSLPYDNVVFMGEVEDAYGFIRSRAVMIVPILSGSGMRIKIIEGMALEKAIVTTSIGTEGITTTHGKNILIADDPSEFAQHVCDLVASKEYCLEIGRNARKFVISHYDNETITRSLAEFYSKLMI
ncbi:MAG: glycosyltransferase family 4 protein [Bacteroidales bacterium]|nr:glycosyltransferase family 4 protein [Bacteroidales bacterium]